MIGQRMAIPAIERQKRIRYFGQANPESNKGLTIIGPLTYIRYLDEESKIEMKQPLTKFKTNENSKAYRPNLDRVKSVDFTKQTISKDGFVKGSYMPSNVIQLIKEEENIEKISVVLKNFPTHMDKHTLENMFDKHFKVYGDIKRITILTNNNNTIKDIAFIEYYNNKDALKVFENPKRLIIGRQIVSIEKNKQKKKI